jgi:hypothetical protein
VDLILDGDAESWLRIGRESDDRRNLEHLIRAVQCEETRPTNTGDIRELREQECRRCSEIGCFRDDGEKLGEPLSRQLGYSR